MRCPFVRATALAAVISSSTAFAGTVQIVANAEQSTGHIGFFVGTVTYTSSASNLGLLTISLTNTTPSAQPAKLGSPTLTGGYITGVVFNIPSLDSSAFATLTSAPNANFVALANPPASPFGTYEAGAALGGSWLGGGSPVTGIAAGKTGTFMFQIHASDAAVLTAGAFVSGSSPGNVVTPPSGLLVRFKGFQPDGSDKVPAAIVPAPGAAGLLALGGLLASRRRRSR